MNYETVAIPFYARLGIFNNLDLGFSLKTLSNSLKKDGAKYSGSSDAVFSPELKWAINQKLSILGILTLNNPPHQTDPLPVGNGNDWELVGCYSPGTTWPLHFNVGYVWRRPYKNKFGVVGGPVTTFEPGNIFEARGALEIPLRYNFSLLTETAYYYVGTQKVSGVPISGTAGTAWDALAGLNWEWKGWILGVEGGLGLLDESHTSFDLERGAGDGMVVFYTSYRLPPWWSK